MSRGQGTIVAPGGEIIAGPMVDTETIVYAKIDTTEVLEAAADV